MKEALTKLIKVKTIVTIMITAVFIILALRGEITPEYVMTIVTTVIAFYFGTQSEKKDSTSYVQLNEDRTDVSDGTNLEEEGTVEDEQ